ncbi:MAG: hypothetical protein IJF78_09565 [Clostridia bacterium]|nr:hypothetical protein [Clostridia bacterium]
MIRLSSQTVQLLEDIERRIDPEAEEDFARQWEDFLNNRFTGDIFTPHRPVVSAPGFTLPGVNINDAISDYEQMLIHQLQGVSHALNTRNQNLCVRANYGTGILSSLFGAEIFEMPRQMNTLPTTRTIGDTEKIREISECGIPDLMGGFGRRVFEFGELCREVFAGYPKIEKYVSVYHPDTQGPLDICELLWGCEMFYAMYEEPDLVHAMMTLLTDTYTAFMKRWYAIYPIRPDINVHWAGIRHKGVILLRDDSAMNLSPDLYAEFAAPYDGELLKRFGGGAVHFCGRGDHYIETLTSLPGLTGINMSQPELNDMEKIYRCTVDRGIKLLAFSRGWAEKDKARGFCGNLCS